MPKDRREIIYGKIKSEAAKCSKHYVSEKHRSSVGPRPCSFAREYITKAEHISAHGIPEKEKFAEDMLPDILLVGDKGFQEICDLYSFAACITTNCNFRNTIERMYFIFLEGSHMKSGCQIYVKGAAEAVALYQRAFNLTLDPDMIHMADDGVTYIHASLMSGENQIIAVGEDTENWCDQETKGNKCPLMAFNIYDLGTREAVDHAYSILSEDARINMSPKGPACPSWDEDGNEYWFDLVDKFGVRLSVGK